jgi:hypothetical protein
VAAAFSPDRLPELSQGRRSCDHPRQEENHLMGSMVPGAMEVLVGWLSGRPVGVACSGAGRWRPRGHRLGQLVHLVDVAAPGLPEPLVSSGTRPIGVNHAADPARSASAAAPW